MREKRGIYRILVRKPEGKRILGRPRRRWEDNVKMDLQEVGTLARAISVRSLASMRPRIETGGGRL